MQNKLTILFAFAIFVVLAGDHARELIGESRPAIGNLDLREREDLEASAVGQDGSVPAHELVQPTHLGDEGLTRTQRQVIGVREHDLRARCAHLLGRHRLDGAVGAHGHEGGRRECAVVRREAPRARSTRRAFELEVERCLGHRVEGSGSLC